MKTEIILKLLIQLLTNCNVGEEFPSIKNLSDKWSCSRGIIQSCLTLLQDEEAIVLEKSKSGTKLHAINIEALRKIYFNNELKISLPMSILNNETDYNILNSINTYFSFIDSSLFTSFEQSAIQRIQQLEDNRVHMAVVTDIYFELLNSTKYKVIKSFEISNPSKLTYTFKPNDEGTFLIEEKAISYQDNFNANKRVTIQLYKPTSYFIITKTDKYNLLNEDL